MTLMQRAFAATVTAIGAAFAVTPVFAAPEDAGATPAFIRMYGEWESVAVRTEPSSVLEAMPALAVLHHIVGEPTGIQPGVHFLVEQHLDGETQLTELTYVHDAAAGKSFGVIASGDGSVLRGVIEHHDDHDVLRLFSADGDVVWTERNVWVSPDSFNSEASFLFEGREASVWFVTRRKNKFAGE